MAFDKELAARVEEMLFELDAPGLVGKKMFGGVGYMVRGNMAGGVLEDTLIVRVGKDAYEETLQMPGTDIFNTTGRPMTGWVKVAAKFVQTPDDLRDWVRKGLDFALTLPPK